MTQYLLVIGAQRSGTTYLYEVLREHPDIAMAHPARPEPKVFLDEEKCRRGLEWYEATYFAGQGDVPVHGDKSTSYLECPDAARRAADLVPDAHVLVMLRNPIARAVSNWHFSTIGGFETRPLEQSLCENLHGSRPWDPALTSVSPFAYLERGRYMDYLRPWSDAFGTRLQVLFTSETVGNADAVRKIYSSLGVDSSFRPTSLSQRINESGAPSMLVLPAELHAQMRQWFSDSDEELRRWLGRPLPWAID